MVRIVAYITVSALFAVAFLNACEDRSRNPLAPDRAGPPEESRGAIQVSIVLSGDEPNVDGWYLVLNDGWSQAVQAGEPLLIAGLSPGAYEVELLGLASNCDMGARSRTVRVEARQITEIEYAVTCGRSGKYPDRPDRPHAE